MERETDRSVTVCFSGHRVIPPSKIPVLKARLRSAVRDAYERGYRVFVCGGARGFDTLAALEILRFRSSFPDMKLVIAVPCATQAERWPEKDRAVYCSVLEQADETVILSEDYYNGCMQNRDRYMVDLASLCVCFLNRFEGGTWYTVRYALRSGIPVNNLAMPCSDGAKLKENPWNCMYTSLSAQKNANTALLFLSRRRTGRKTRTLKRSCVKRSSAGRR